MSPGELIIPLTVRGRARDTKSIVDRTRRKIESVGWKIAGRSKFKREIYGVGRNDGRIDGVNEYFFKLTSKERQRNNINGVWNGGSAGESLPDGIAPEGHDGLIRDLF